MIQRLSLEPMNLFRQISLNLIKNFDIPLGFLLFFLSSLCVFFGGNYFSGLGADQSSIEAISNLILAGKDLNQGNLSHGIGYPLMVLPFQSFEFLNPLNAANSFLFVLAFSVSWRAIHSFKLRKLKKALLLIFLCLSFVLSPDIYFWVVGASNAISACFLICLVSWSITRHPPKYLPFYIAFFVGLDFSARYIDPFLLTPLFLSAIANYCRYYSKNFAKILTSLIVLSCLFIAPTLLFHYSVLGSITSTPYDDKIPATSRLISSVTGEGVFDQANSRYFEWIVPNLLSTFIEPGIWASKSSVAHGKTALQFSPILLILPYSLVLYLLIFISSSTKFKLASKHISVFTAFIASLTLYLVFYASGWAYTAHDLKYYCLRYFMGWFSIGLFSALAVFILANQKSFYIKAGFYSLLAYLPLSLLVLKPNYLANIFGKRLYFVSTVMTADPSAVHGSIKKNLPRLSSQDPASNFLRIAENNEHKITLDYDTIDERFAITQCRKEPQSRNDLNHAKCNKRILKNSENVEVGKILNFATGFKVLNLKSIESDQALIELCLNVPCLDNIKVYRVDSGLLFESNDNSSFDHWSRFNSQKNNVFSYDPIPWHKSNLIEVNVPMHFQNDSTFKLSIWSDKSQDQFFPNQLRVLCLSGNKQIASCGAVKIGRFNNTWTLWIKSLSNEAITSLRLSFDKVDSNPNAVPFLKIYYSD